MFPSSFLLRNRNIYQQGTYDCIFFPLVRKKKHFTDEIVLLCIVKVFECVSSSLCSLLTLQPIWINSLPFFFNCRCKAHCCHNNPFPPSMYLKNMFFIMFFFLKKTFFGIQVTKLCLPPTFSLRPMSKAHRRCSTRVASIFSSQELYCWCPY